VCSSDLEHYKQILSLPPAVHAAKRTKEVNQINLKKPAFSYDLTYWERLSEALLPAELKAQIADCDLLCFVPHGPLHLLPFAALRWSAQEYLIERFGICTVNTASVLRYCQSKNRQRAAGPTYRPSSCLVAAVAAQEDQDPQEFEADGDDLALLFQEPDANDKITSLIGASLTDGGQPASKELIQRAIGDHDVIHLACHGVFGVEGNSRDPLDSGLLVSDGGSSPSLAKLREMSAAERSSHLLTAREVFSLKLTADLVTLRACSSGRAAIQSGDELVGLTRAFLFAGAPSLIVSLWNVNKRSSRQLLNDFYRRWLDRRHPLPKWQALQQAQISMLKDKDSEYRHPYHWAPFILVGDWL